MTKAQLRQQFLAQRRSLSTDSVHQSSQSIARRFFNYFEPISGDGAPAVVHTFLPIRQHNEVDTWPIVRCIWEQFDHVQISVPVIDSATGRMQHYTIFPDTLLVENRLGIPEPLLHSVRKTDIDRIIVVLVPLLAFDQQGQRVGYGGGYYDRFLADCGADCRKIGLSLFEPVKQIDDIEPTDIQLDACITPKYIYRFI